MPEYGVWIFAHTLWPVASSPSWPVWSASAATMARPAAVNAAERYLAGHDPKFTRLHGFALARYARALPVDKEIAEATTRLAEAADITRQHSSARLAQEIHQARARLEPWATTTYVHQLDETLRFCGLTSAGPAAKA
jgi:hypothetical protein